MSTVGAETSRGWAKRAGGETSRAETYKGRNVLVAKRPWAKCTRGETSRGRNVLVAKPPGCETSSEGAKRPGAKRPVTRVTTLT